MRSVVLWVLLCATGFAHAAPGEVSLDANALKALARMPVGGKVDLAEFPVGPGILAAITFERIDVYAPDARIVEITATGERELPRSVNTQLLGLSADRSTRLALTLDPMGNVVYGAGSGPAGGFVVRSEARAGGGWTLTALDADRAHPEGVVPVFENNIDTAVGPDSEDHPLETLLGGPVVNGSVALRVGVVAIDTDNEFLSERFANNAPDAVNWIAVLFANLNVFYRNDLVVVLQQGTTFLRTTAPDPYTNTDTPANQAALVEFGTYWQNNYASVPRAFAMLFSGKSSSGNSSSGIAWLNQFCKTAGNNGSYSVNQVFTNPGIGASQNAFLVGHELGHNFGARHTHCANATSGSGNTGVNTIDQCYASESGCYTGTTSCPTSGPGAPLGTLMSYCHLRSPSCGSNVLQFHPTHVSQLRANIAATPLTCLRLDTIFATGFQ